jgi:hypothetical protein
MLLGQGCVFRRMNVCLLSIATVKLKNSGFGVHLFIRVIQGMILRTASTLYEATLHF